MVSTDASSETPDSRQKEEDEESTLLKEEFEPLNKQVIDDFTNEALQGCLCLLDSLPNTVYRVCDLLISIFNRNGPEFKQATLNELMQEVTFLLVLNAQIVKYLPTNVFLRFKTL